MADTELTDELDHIRATAELASELPMTADPRRAIRQIPRLLGAIEAVLELHVEAVIEDMRPPRFHYCSRCSGHPAWPCPEVAAISRHLLGGEPNG